MTMVGETVGAVVAMTFMILHHLSAAACAEAVGGKIYYNESSSQQNHNIEDPQLKPIAPQGPPGQPGRKYDGGEKGPPGFPYSIPGKRTQLPDQVAFWVGLNADLGPSNGDKDIKFDRVVTNIGNAYNPSTGRFTATKTGVYQFSMVLSAQPGRKAGVRMIKNGVSACYVWAESIPNWSTSTNVAILSLKAGDQVWIFLRKGVEYVHGGVMYTTFSGFRIPYLE